MHALTDSTALAFASAPLLDEVPPAFAVGRGSAANAADAAGVPSAHPLERRDLDPPPPSGLRRAASVDDGGASLARASDAELARLAAGGHAEAARAIWRRYSLLVRLKLRKCIGAQDLDDHVQEVFLRFYERLPQLREHGALRFFLVGIALRVAATELRRRRFRRWCLTADGELPESTVTTSPDFDAKEALARFDAILASFGPHAREVFELRYVERMELADIAAALGTSLATTKRHLARASARVFAMVERDPSLLEYWRASPLEARASSVSASTATASGAGRAAGGAEAPSPAN